MPETRSIFAVETGLLMKQLNEAQQLGFCAKERMLIKRRRQRQARKGLVRKSLARSVKIARRSINKRKITMIKAVRKKNRTKRLFRKVRVFKPRLPRRPKAARPRKQIKHK